MIGGEKHLSALRKAQLEPCFLSDALGTGRVPSPPRISLPVGDDVILTRLTKQAQGIGGEHLIGRAALGGSKLLSPPHS